MRVVGTFRFKEGRVWQRGKILLCDRWVRRVFDIPRRCREIEIRQHGKPRWDAVKIVAGDGVAWWVGGHSIVMSPHAQSWLEQNLHHGHYFTVHYD